MFRVAEEDSPFGLGDSLSCCNPPQMEECESCLCENQRRELGYIHVLETTWLLVQGPSIKHDKTTLHNHSDHEATE